MKKVLLIVVLILLTDCSTKSEIDKILEENNYIIIDVRTSLEYESGHIKDSINIPYDNLVILGIGINENLEQKFCFPK